jgi:L-aminopeptidase/D-esterase-like protein
MMQEKNDHPGGTTMRTIARSVLVAAAFAFSQGAQSSERARDLGIPFDGVTGPLNAITDVAGVEVGQVSIIEDLPDDRAVRTGVTAVLPRGAKESGEPVFAGWFSLNGNGEMTGTTWIEESGFLEGPVMITNTHSVGTVHQATIDWRVSQGRPDETGYWWSLPVVAETWDGHLNDINGFHVKAEHVHAALRSASGGPVAEGNVGSGTGMICHEFKCGIGSSSRIAEIAGSAYTIGVLVQANYGLRNTLRIAGVPVGQHLTEDRAYASLPQPVSETGSIIVVVATDAPLLPHQLKRIAKRAGLGIARVGGMAGNGSGDIFVAFSTAGSEMNKEGGVMAVHMLANDAISPLFDATVLATEEAIVNAMVAATDMKGDRGHVAKAIDHEQLQRVLRQYNRLGK